MILPRNNQRTFSKIRAATATLCELLESDH